MKTYRVSIHDDLPAAPAPSTRRLPEKIGFHIRLTEDERALLERCAARDGRSMQSMAARALVAELLRLEAETRRRR